ncbi:MAG: hypothetical protein V1770_05235, partial [bacterium]
FKFQKNIKYPISNIKCQRDGLLEYVGPKDAETVIVAMGSVVGTIRHSVQEMCSDPTPTLPSKGRECVPPLSRRGIGGGSVGILKIKSFRPFPSEEIRKALKNAKYVAVLEKAISLGNEGILAGEIKQALYGTGIKVKGYVGGLGGRDVTRENIREVIKDVRRKGEKVRFI